jgi:hypothetical protein
MSTVSRAWATPLTIAAFALVAVTGISMFFHLDLGLSHPVHEWIGWGLVAAVALHATANWLAFKRYFTAPGPARWVVGGALLVLAGVLAAPAPEGASPPVLALNAVVDAPIATAAALAGKPTEQALAELAAAGLVMQGPGQSIRAAAGGERERIGQAIRVLFGRPPA